MNTEKKIRPFGARDKFGYLFGDFGNDFTFILSTMILMKFYTDVMGVSAAVVGTIMMIARFVDAFTDVTMGRICDRSKTTKAGKFKPWILRMCGPVAIASFLMYQSAFANMSMTFKIGYLFVTYILWGSIFYTSINIPYGSMASAISSDPGDRQSLSTFRTMGGTLAGMVIGVLLPILAYENNILVGSKVTIVAGLFSVLAIGAYLLCYFMVTERVRPEVTEDEFKKNSVGKMLLNAVNNRALLSIIVASIVMLLAQLTMQNMAAYVFPDYYQNATAQSASTLTMMVGMFVAAGVSKPLAKKFGKAEVSIVSNLFAAVVCFILFIVRPQNVWIYIAFQTLCWLGLGIFSMVSWALITDVIDYSEIKNGIREDGSVYALYSFARKLGQAVAAGLSGWLLTWIGYDTELAAQAIRQSKDVLEGVFNVSTLVPAVGFLLLALVLWFWYPLHKKQVDANVAILKEKHGETVEE
ncbi:MAG: MFS transporter [Ruminococcaceae bacterium]|nr:MFS transporter [Oscillospiraceae bacterium]